MSAHIPLNRVAAWFIMRICPIACYNDVMRLLLRQFTLFDRAMMHEAMTARPYGNPAYIWMLALYEQPALAPSLRARFDKISFAPLLPFNNSAIADIVYAFERLRDVRKWVKKCTKCRIDAPFMFVLHNISHINQFYGKTTGIPITKYSLAQYAVESNSLTCLRACCDVSPEIIKCSFDVRPSTWLWLMQAGAQLVNAYNTDILDCIAESPAHGDMLLRYIGIKPIDMIGEAISKGKLLYWLHERITIDTMLLAHWEGWTMSSTTAKWFIDKGVPITKLRNYNWGSIKYVYPIATPVERAHMLSSDIAVCEWYIYIYRKQQRKPAKYNLTYDRDLFLHLASCQIIQYLQKADAPLHAYTH